MVGTGNTVESPPVNTLDDSGKTKHAKSYKELIVGDVAPPGTAGVRRKIIGFFGDAKLSEVQVFITG